MGGEADKTMAQRKKRARPGPEGPGAYKGDANAGPKGIYRATNVGRSACTSRRGGIACRGETRETEQRRRRDGAAGMRKKVEGGEERV